MMRTGDFHVGQLTVCILICTFMAQRSSKILWRSTSSPIGQPISLSQLL